MVHSSLGVLSKMEESEKRRERLKAIRMGAAQAETRINEESTSNPNFLSNPLIEPSKMSPDQNKQPSAPRFDYYTDPVSAFCVDRRNKLFRDQITSSSPWNPQMAPSPISQFHPPFSPNHSIHHSPNLHQTPNAHMNSFPIDNPYSMHQGIPNQTLNHSPSFRHTPNFPRVPFQINTPYPMHQGNPNQRVYHHGTPHFTPSACGKNPSPNFASPRHVEPKSFYKKSMMEDPWKFLTPVMWVSCKPRNPWLSNPNASGMKKAKTMESQTKTDFQGNLAEYLAKSFNDAVIDS